ncbi:hypothetical protein GCM10010304_77290 [Streptomyces roseoviolaceus]
MYDPRQRPRAAASPCTWCGAERGASSGEVTVPAGQFIVRHNVPPVRFEVAPRTAVKVLSLPAAQLKPLIGDRSLVGPADLAEVRLLMGYATVVDATLNDLSPAVGRGRGGGARVRCVRGWSAWLRSSQKQRSPPVSCAALDPGPTRAGGRDPRLKSSTRTAGHAWSPKCLAEVTDADVERFFTPLGERELGLSPATR